MIVVDTQILIYATLRTPESVTIDAVRAMDSRWVTTTLWASELRNVLAGYTRRGVIQAADAIRTFEVAEGLLEQSIEPETSRVVALISASTCTAYDLEFVAVAQQLGLPLVTSDRQILSEFPAIAVTPAAFVSG